MSARKKFRAAFGAEGTTRVPAAICYTGIFLRDHWDDLTDRPWWTQFDPDPVERAQPEIDMVGRTGMDWFRIHLCAPKGERVAQSIEIDGDAVYLVAKAAGERRELRRPPISGTLATAEGRKPPPPAVGVSDIDALDRIIDRHWGARPYATPERMAEDGRFDLARELTAALGNTHFAHAHVSTPLWQATSLWGYEGLMQGLYDFPKLITYACDRILESVLAEIGWYAAAGADCIWFEECMTDMIGPVQFRTLNLPLVRRMAEAVTAAGMKSIYYYCGNPHLRWDELFDSGADALALEESKKGFDIDIAEVAARSKGRMALLGNLDAINLLPKASESDLRQEIERQCRAGAANDGRFVMSLGSPVTPDTPVRRVRTYCDLVHEVIMPRSAQ